MKKIKRIVNWNEPEVKFAGCAVMLMMLFFFVIDFYNNFFCFVQELSGIFLGLIAGAISLVGVAIAGVAIVITMFNVQEVRLLNKIHKDAIENLLLDFKWLAQVGTVNVAVYLAFLFVVRLPYALVPALAFYIIVALLLYSVFYLLFYGCELIGNCVDLLKIKINIDEASKDEKNAPLMATEWKLDFLIAKMLEQDEKKARQFYTECITLLESDELKNKEKAIDYLKKRHDIQS